MIAIIAVFVFLFIFFIGDEVVIVKSDLRICGCGAALATGPINQNKAYFEVKVQCGGKQIQPDTETFLVGGWGLKITQKRGSPIPLHKMHSHKNV